MILSDDELDTLTDYASDLDFTVRTGYSGRCMYGATCVGIVGRGEATEVIGYINEDHPDLAAKLLRGMRTDSMGLSTIYYWPNLTVDSSTDED